MTLIHSAGVRRSVWLWALYDFANSLGFISLSFYFALWLVTEHNVSDIWVSASLALATLIMLFTAPVLGHLSDRSTRRLPFLAFFTFTAIGSLLALGVIGGHVQTITTNLLIVIFLIYGLFHFCYQSCFTFYNALIHDLVGERSHEQVSGIGEAMGMLGNVGGLLIVLPVVKGNIAILGVQGRPAAFIVGAVLFFLVSLPTFIFLKEAPHVSPSTARTSFSESVRRIALIRRYPKVLLYLLTYNFFSDAILTLNLYASTYLDVVAHLSDQQKTIAFLFSIVGGVAGSFSAARIAKFFGSTKRTIGVFLLFWAVLLVLLALASTGLMFSILIALNGFTYGVLFPLSRAFYAKIIPQEQQGEFFGFYSLFERAASIVGPFLWSGTALLFIAYGPDRFRFSILALAALTGVSWLVLRWVKEA